MPKRRFYIVWLCLLPLFGLLLSVPQAGASDIAKAHSRIEWQPKLGDSFQLQLSGVIRADINAKIYDIDLFDSSLALIASLKMSDRRVVCYFSAGSSEKWRSDYKRFAPSDKGKALDGWPGENWLDIRSGNIRKIMRTRMDLAVKKGCDGVDPDNVDGYSNSTGFSLTYKNELDYNKFLAGQAHMRGLAIGLKNDMGQIPALAPSYDFAVNEQCHQFDECAGYGAFTSLGKPVLNVEYQQRYMNNTDGALVALCATAHLERLYTLVLPLVLDGTSRFSCDTK